MDYLPYEDLMQTRNPVLMFAWVGRTRASRLRRRLPFIAGEKDYERWFRLNVNAAWQLLGTQPEWLGTSDSDWFTRGWDRDSLLRQHVDGAELWLFHCTPRYSGAERYVRAEGAVMRERYTYKPPLSRLELLLDV